MTYIDDADRMVTTADMIRDLRSCARFVRDKTPMPLKIVEMLDDVADEVEIWSLSRMKGRYDG